MGIDGEYVKYTIAESPRVATRKGILRTGREWLKPWEGPCLVNHKMLWEPALPRGLIPVYAVAVLC